MQTSVVHTAIIAPVWKDQGNKKSWAAASKQDWSPGARTPYYGGCVTNAQES